MFKNKYNLPSRFLHRVVLSNNLIKDILFDFEKFFFKRKHDKLNQKNIFISGLARSGTTILNNFFFKTGHFASFTYRDMPFVMAPNIWNLITNKFQKDSGEIERAHDDNLKINYDSPENFDEIFFKTKLKGKYFLNDSLCEHKLNNEIIDDFKIYISNILLKNKKKFYLSKNNNNILRLNSLSEKFKDSFFIILFRHPIQQAYSLLTQHKNFITLQAQDKFNLEYMNFLSHHEFGLGQKKFKFNETTKENNFDNSNINYWINEWMNVYSHILKISKSNNNIYLINYEKLCESPKKNLAPFLEEFEISQNYLNNFKFNKSEKKIDQTIDEKLKEEALKIYIELLEK